MSLGLGAVFVAVASAANAGVAPQGRTRRSAPQRLTAGRRRARTGDLLRDRHLPDQPPAGNPHAPSRGAHLRLSAGAAGIQHLPLAAAVVALRVANTRGEEHPPGVDARPESADGALPRPPSRRSRRLPERSAATVRGRPRRRARRAGGSVGRRAKPPRHSRPRRRAPLESRQRGHHPGEPEIVAASMEWCTSLSRTPGAISRHRGPTMMTSSVR